MSDFTATLAAVCEAENQRFAGRTETEDPQFRFVGEYWQSIGINLNGQTVVDGKRPAWSSAFVSFCVRKAGAGQHFRYAEAHCHYTMQSIRLAEGEANGHGYVAHRPEIYAPKVGDIIVAGRESAAGITYDQAKLLYLADSFFPSHADIVVKVREESVETIGGNITTDTVGRRIRRTGPGGRLKKLVVDGHERAWIAVLECLL
jgi:hypothetical protein